MSACAKSLLTSARDPQSARLVMRYQFISGASASGCLAANLRIAGLLITSQCQRLKWLSDTDNLDEWVKLVGFDNAHPMQPIAGPGGKSRKGHDHKHRLRMIRPYDYKDAATLLTDFWTEVDAVLKERGVIP